MRVALQKRQRIMLRRKERYIKIELLLLLTEKMFRRVLMELKILLKNSPSRVKIIFSKNHVDVCLCEPFDLFLGPSSSSELVMFFQDIQTYL